MCTLPRRGVWRPSWPDGGDRRRPGGRNRLHPPAPAAVWGWVAAVLRAVGTVGGELLAAWVATLNLQTGGLL